jgi:hypothetical protein
MRNYMKNEFAAKSWFDNVAQMRIVDRTPTEQNTSDCGYSQFS